MTTLGGLGHTLPFLIAEFHTALVVAMVVVAIELAAISLIRNRYMDTPLLRAAFQVVVGGVLVFFTGVLIGGAGDRRRRDLVGRAAPGSGSSVSEVSIFRPMRTQKPDENVRVRLPSHDADARSAEQHLRPRCRLYTAVRQCKER
jgi:hypothetical protein